MKPKLLVCLPFLTPSIGGGAMVFINLLEPLVAEGFDITVVYFQERAKNFIPEGFKSYALIKHVGAAKYYLEYLRIILSMAKILREEKPDVVLCNSYQPFWICLAARRIAGHKIPIITGEHNNLAIMFRGAKMGHLRLYLNCKLDSFAATIIAPSKGIARHLIDDLGLPAGNIQAIYNPVPIEPIQKSAKSSPEHSWFKNKEKPVLVNVGVLDDQKDQKTLLHAFAIARKIVPCHLVFVGGGPLLAELQEETKTLGITEDVAFLGFQDNPFQFMAHADAFVLSSRYEGLPLVLIEAMACGCPVVSTDCDYGPREIIEDGISGLLSPVGNVDLLAANIIRVLSDDSLRKSLIENGVKRAQDFSAKVAAKQYAEVILACIAKGRS
jgi:glycosyltransferase involved in cell wall biosynthesis